jgi:hypothetical protein
MRGTSYLGVVGCEALKPERDGVAVAVWLGHPPHQQIIHETGRPAEGPPARRRWEWRC